MIASKVSKTAPRVFARTEELVSTGSIMNPREFHGPVCLPRIPSVGRKGLLPTGGVPVLGQPCKPNPDAPAEHGSQQTYYRWKAKYGGLEVSEAQRLRHLEEENRKLKQLVAEQALDIVGFKAVLSKKW